MKTWRDTLETISHLLPCESLVVPEDKDFPAIMILSRKWYRHSIGEFGDAGKACHELLHVPENVFDCETVLAFGEAGKQDKRLTDCALVSWTNKEVEKLKRGWRAARRAYHKNTSTVPEQPRVFDSVHYDVVLIEIPYDLWAKMFEDGNGKTDDDRKAAARQLVFEANEESYTGMPSSKRTHVEFNPIERRVYLWWERDTSTYKSTARIVAKISMRLPFEVPKDANYDGIMLLCHLCDEPTDLNLCTDGRRQHPEKVAALLCTKHCNEWVQWYSQVQGAYDVMTHRTWIEKAKKRQQLERTHADDAKDYAFPPGKVIKVGSREEAEATCTNPLQLRIGSIFKLKSRAVHDYADGIKGLEVGAKEQRRVASDQDKLAKDFKFLAGEANLALMATQEQLEELVREVRGVVQRTQKSWPRCSACEMDYEIRELEADGVGLGHVCLNASEKEKKVKTLKIVYNFSPELTRKLKDAEILK